MASTLIFLGTRGEIDRRSRLHHRRSSVLIRCKAVTIMIDRGRDRLRLPRSPVPDGILLTHAHEDHAGGLAQGASGPVYATAKTLALLARYPISDPRPIAPRPPVRLGPTRIEAFTLQHSIRAPAVGYRVTQASTVLFYAPDVAAIDDRHEALDGVNIYIGDGATMVHSMVRQRGVQKIGHASIRSQLDWCRREGVRQAIFTHCGSGIVRGDGRRVNAVLRRLRSEFGVAARLARDGLVIPFVARRAQNAARQPCPEFKWPDRHLGGFAATIANTLFAGNTSPAPVLAAPPAFLAELRKRLPKQARAAVVAEVDKDLLHLPVAEIELNLFGS
jgi:phosphoribosyl 1,2-cyclic phosphodiesterase